MIGWRIDVGYSNTAITSLSDITFTDTDRLFFAATVNNGIPDYEKKDYATTDLAYNRIKDLVGIDVNVACGVPLKIIYNYVRPYFVEKYFPSFFFQYPNLISLLDRSGILKYIFIYFKNINKLFEINFYSNYSTYYSYYNVNGNSISKMQSIDTNIASMPRLNYMSVEAQYSPGSFLYCHLDSDGVADSAINIAFNFSAKADSTVEIRKANPNNTFDFFYKILYHSKPDSDGLPKDPYEEGETSGEGDLPPGTFDDESDPIPLPSLPTVSAANTGFTRIYNPTLSQVQQLASYLWTDDNVLTTIWNHIKQIFEDPMQAMIGFNLVPVPVQDAGSEEFRILYIGTGVYMNVAANQFVDVDCGTVQVQRYYGSALDQSPYTKVSCFLPYIGQVQLDTDEVMGTTLQVVYRVDIVTGSCVAMILVDSNVLYQYSGHCAITIPFASADFSRYVAAAIDIAKIDGAISGGLSISQLSNVRPPEASPSTSSSASSSPTRARSLGVSNSTSTPQPWNANNVPLDMNNVHTSTQVSFKGLSPESVTNTVGAVMGAKPNINHAGYFSGNTGYLGVRRPYLIIERPNMCLPANYQKLNGYPSMITLTLGDCQGFTRVQQVQLTGMSATNPEQSEILELLKIGVVL